MCGIFGTYGGSKWDVESGLDRIAHRGPDGRGIETAGLATHGHVRLSLVDLSSASSQPFRISDASKTGVLSFVGEIWNHNELRDSRQAAGKPFATTGDTEVLADHLLSGGRLDGLDGMFAFVWTHEGRTRLARDRFGKVPLYVMLRPDGSVEAWSSERKAFGKWGSQAQAVPAGCYVEAGTGRIVRWYDPPLNAPLEDSRRGILDLLRDGVRKRLAADAPVAVLCSGGLDSSLILALAVEAGAKPTAYTAVYDQRADDLLAARKLCSEFGVPLREVHVGQPTFQQVEEAVAAIEIPTKAQVEIAVLCLPLARRMKADGFKACLSGEAADELFFGYGNAIIKGHREDDQGWKQIRLEQLRKMARGNFVRCNKAFMAGGIECRLPFMERALVEKVLAMGKRECPGAKKALKDAAAPVLPKWCINRQKETFQGGSGMANAIAKLVADPAAIYKCEIRKAIGGLVND